MKLPGSGGTGAFCSLHTALVTKQTRWGLIPPGGRRPISGQWTAGGKCSPREVLELGKMREGAVCQEAGTIPARTGQAQVEPHLRTAGDPASMCTQIGRAHV